MVSAQIQSRANISRIAICISILFILTAYVPPSQALDFNGNGVHEVVLWERESGNFLAISADGALSQKQCGLPGDIPLAGDVDGDGSDDAVVFRRTPSADSSGTFYLCVANGAASMATLGRAGDLPIANADFDGDGKDDLAVFRATVAGAQAVPGSGLWMVRQSSNGAVREISWGQEGDIPAPADFDGDGKADVAVYRPGAGTYRILKSATNQESIIPLGQTGDLPVPGDYDGDSLTDPAVFEAATGNWLVRYSSEAGAIHTAQFGQSEDIPVPADLNGDGNLDLAVYRPFSGSILWAANPDALNPAAGPVRSTRINGIFLRKAVANRVSIRKQIFADFDGDYRTDYALARLVGTQLTWFVADVAGRTLFQQPWGIVGDRLAPGDWDGDGLYDLGIVRSGGGGLSWYFLSTRNRVGWSSAFGLSSDIVKVADFDGDGRSDQAVVRVDSNNALRWFVSRSSVKTPLEQSWGTKGDLPVSGDFTGDGAADFAVVRNQAGLLYWYILSSDGRMLPVTQWGLAGDQVVPGDYDGDGRDDFAVVRSINGQVYTFVLTQAGAVLTPAAWGLSGDQIAHGYYTGSPAKQLSVWRPGPFAPAFFVDRSPNLVQRVALFFTQLAYGLPKDTVISEQNVGAAVAAEPTPTPSGSGSSSSVPSTTDNRLASLCPTIRELGAPELYKRGSSSHIPGADTRSGKPSYIGKLRVATRPSYECVDILDSNGTKISAFGRYPGAGLNYQFRYYVGQNASRCGGGHTANQIDARARRNTGSPTIYIKKSADLCLRLRAGALTSRQGSVK